MLIQIFDHVVSVLILLFVVWVLFWVVRSRGSVLLIPGIPVWTRRCLFIIWFVLFASLLWIAISIS